MTVIQLRKKGSIEDIEVRRMIEDTLRGGVERRKFTWQQTPYVLMLWTVRVTVSLCILLILLIILSLIVGIMICSGMLAIGRVCVNLIMMIRQGEGNRLSLWKAELNKVIPPFAKMTGRNLKAGLQDIAKQIKK